VELFFEVENVFCYKKLNILKFMSATPKLGLMKRQFLLLFICMLVLAFVHAQQTQQAPAQQKDSADLSRISREQFPDGSAYKNATITYNIVDAANSTYGYDVFVDGRLMIRQTSIPAMSGNEGFKTKDDVTKVAELVKYKTSKDEMPPTVTPEEMKSLGVIKK
jgi:hypothetical protein